MYCIYELSFRGSSSGVLFSHVFKATGDDQTLLCFTKMPWTDSNFSQIDAQVKMFINRRCLRFLTSAWLFSDITKTVDPTRWMSYHSSSSCKSGGFFQIISSHSMKRGVNRKMLPSQFFFGHRIVGPGYATFWTRPELAGQHLGPWECLPCLVAVTFWCLRRPFLPRRRCVCCHNLQAAQKPLNVRSLLKQIDVQLSKIWKLCFFVQLFGPDLLKSLMLRCFVPDLCGRCAWIYVFLSSEVGVLKGAKPANGWVGWNKW